MNELKEHQFCESDEFFREYPGPLSNETHLYYLKSEADKVLAEKDAEIAKLQAMLEAYNKQVAELKYELAVATGDCQALAGKFGG